MPMVRGLLPNRELISAKAETGSSNAKKIRLILRTEPQQAADEQEGILERSVVDLLGEEL